MKNSIEGWDEEEEMDLDKEQMLVKLRMPKKVQKEGRRQVKNFLFQQLRKLIKV
jgi:hypothetical protein